MATGQSVFVLPRSLLVSICLCVCFGGVAMSFLQLEFVQNAFIAGTIVAIVAAVVGYFVVLRAQAFAGHALSHIGFAGATGAALLGVSALLGTFALTLLAEI